MSASRTRIARGPQLIGRDAAGPAVRDPQRRLGQPGVEVRRCHARCFYRDHALPVIRHLLAPVNRGAAAALKLPRTVPAGGVALTFDDGPHPEGTPAVLEVLARAGVRATFFVIGEQVRRRPELVARAAAAGHAIALHGDRHRLQLRMSAAAVAEDLKRGMAAIEDATGAPPAWHRPPFGIYSPAGLRGGAGGRPDAAAVVALGQGLAEVDHSAPDRRSGHAQHASPAT